MRWHLLHLTDIHFADTYVDDDKIAVPAGAREMLTHRFAPALEEYINYYGLPDALLVTGDLTVRGNADGMEGCRISLMDTALAMKRAERVVAVVPGNHDVIWGVTSADLNPFRRKFESFRKLVEDLDATTGPMPDGRLNDPTFTKSGSVVVDDKQKLVVVCINSAMRCGELNEEQLETGLKLLAGLDAGTATDLKEWMRKQCFFDIAHVTQRQRDILATQIDAVRRTIEASRQNWDEYLRVAIMHHHLVGVASAGVEHKAFETTVDAPQVLKMLADREIDLVLTGHKHSPYAQRIIVRRSNGSDREIVIAGGATVLGGLPRAGAEAGLNKIEITRHPNGASEFAFSVIQIVDEVQHQTPPERLVRVAPASVSPGVPNERVAVGRNEVNVTMPRAQMHEALRLYSGVELVEYCMYCRELALNYERLFALLTIEPVQLVSDICNEIGRDLPPHPDEFVALASRGQLHFDKYRAHPQAVRVVVANGPEWLDRNRRALPYLEALNGGMQCYVVQRKALEMFEPRILLVDHTAVDDQICMYDNAAEVMTVGPIRNLDHSGYRQYFDGKTRLPAIFVPLADYLSQTESGANRVSGRQND